MATKQSEQISAEQLGTATATGIDTTSDKGASHELHFARRGEALAEASSSQESIEGYDPELMSGRTLLTAEEEKKLLRRIDWRLMSLCSLIFMFKNLDSNNVRITRYRGTNGVVALQCNAKRVVLTTPGLAVIQCPNHEQGDGPQYHDAAWDDVG
jgi:hypothetical protein